MKKNTLNFEYVNLTGIKKAEVDGLTVFFLFCKKYILCDCNLKLTFNIILLWSPSSVLHLM